MSDVAESSATKLVTFWKSSVRSGLLKRAAVPVMSHRLLSDSNLYGLARIAESEYAVEAILQTVPSP